MTCSFVLCIIIVKTLILICVLPAEENKREAISPFSFKSMTLQLEKVTELYEEKSAFMCLEREVVKFLQDKDTPILISKMSIFPLSNSLSLYLKTVLFKEPTSLRCNSIMTVDRGHLLSV